MQEQQKVSPCSFNVNPYWVKPCNIFKFSIVATTNLCAFSTFGEQFSTLCFFYFYFFSYNFHTCQWNMMPERIFLGNQLIMLPVSPQGNQDIGIWLSPKYFKWRHLILKKRIRFSVDQELIAVSFRTNPIIFTKIVASLLFTALQLIASWASTVCSYK